MPTPHVLILRSAGTNCDLETEHAWTLAGAAPERVHVRRLIESPHLLDKFQILTIPGGFSYGDDISAGRVLAAQIERHLQEHVRRFIDAGRLVLGICNGFQALVKAGILPQPAEPSRRTCTIAANEPPGFQDRWVCLEAVGSRCPLLEPGRRYEMPIGHGEGRVVFSDDAAFQDTLRSGQDVLRYAPVPPDVDGFGDLPANPNGSMGDIAGLCDPTGRVLGLMPHPERFVAASQHPSWTSRRSGREPDGREGDGLAIFRAAAAYFR
jgi:phosphoribosylformylglycinamidine synthase I